MADAKYTFMSMFHCIPDFKYGLLSMLSPSHLYRFLPAIGYILTEREKKRYMSLDREILKSTGYIDRLLKEGYSVTLVSTNLHELYDVIRGKPVGDDAWNSRPFEWGFVFYNPDGRNDWYDWYRIKIMICITHPRDLAFDEDGNTITRNPDVPVPLPGTWERLSNWGDGDLILERLDRSEAANEYYINRMARAEYYINSISRAKLRIDYDDNWDYKGWTGNWSVCTDIAEDCAEICFFQVVEQEGKPTWLHCQDQFSDFSQLRFLDSNIIHEVGKHFDVEYVRLHRHPLELRTRRAKKTLQGIGPGDPDYRLEFKDLELVDEAGERLHFLTVVYAVGGYWEAVAMIPI